MNKWSIGLLLIASLMAAAGQVFFKLGADGKQLVTEFVNTKILFGLFLYGSGTVIWIIALSKEQLVDVYPYSALTFVLVMLTGYLFLGEKISSVGLAGMVLIVVGLFLVSH